VQLLSIQTLLLFLLAVFYDLSVPSDDGSCNTLTTIKSCLDRVSALDSTRSYCVWDEAWVSSGDGDGSASTQCAFAAANLTWRSVVIVAILVSLITSIIMTPLDYLFDILAAPLADDEKLALQESTGAVAVRTGRRMSAAAINTGRRLSTAAVTAVSGAAKRTTDALGVTRATNLKVGSATILMPESTIKVKTAIFELCASNFSNVILSDVV
jgi:hypothetical protein